MNTMRNWTACALGVALGGSVMAQPVTGMPVPELGMIDNLTLIYMNSNDISGGLVAVMRDGVVIYQRGFGWKDQDRTIPLRHDALMRLASVSKPITAAATQRLFAEGLLDPNDFVFDLGQPQGGILGGASYAPFPALGDPQFDQIRVGMLYTHTSGLASNAAGDPTYRELQIAQDFTDAGDPTMSPPGRLKTLRWIMGRPLSATPGTQRIYSNAGFMALGMVIEQVLGGSGDGGAFISYVRNEVLGPLDWLPTTELVRGRTFQVDADPREPWYDGVGTCSSVFEGQETSSCPYGSWDHEARISQGGMVASSLVLLHLAENYFISDQGWGDPTYGALTNGAGQNRVHNGGLNGVSTYVRGRQDGINIVVMFNKRDGVNFATQFGNQLNNWINLWNAFDIDWPTQGVDGQWIDFANADAGDGSYENSWSNLDLAMASAAHEATINIHEGASSWTGTINQKVRLRAPHAGATVVIGIPD